MLDDRRKLLAALLGSVAAIAVRSPARAQNVQYTYDALGRLTSVTYPSGVIVRYTYDRAGNRLETYSGTNPPPPPPPPPPPAPPTAPLTVGVSATTWFSGPSTGEDAPVAVLVSGGTPPYTWTWQRVTGVPAIQADTPNASWTPWSYTGSSTFPPLKIAIWRCLVTDAASSSAFSPNVEVTIDVS